MTADAATTRGRPPATSRREIVRAARSIVSADGLGALTMRRLGAELGVDPMVPYRLFAGKDELLDAVFVSIIEDLPIHDHLVGVEAVAQGFRDFRDVLVDVPNLVAVVAPRLLTTPAGRIPVDWVVEELGKDGIGAADAERWDVVLLTYVVGSLQVPISDADFEYGLDQLLAAVTAGSDPSVTSSATSPARSSDVVDRHGSRDQRHNRGV